MTIRIVTPQVGMRVQNIRWLDRWPDFLVDQVGLLGTVDLVEPHIILVKMDAPIEGCEEWNNCMQLVPDEFGDFGNGVIIDSMEALFSYYFQPLNEEEQVFLGR